MFSHQNDIPIIQKVCNLYVSSDFITLESISKTPELREYNLSLKKLTEIIHAAIKYNIIDDETANCIKAKAIRHSERKGHTKNHALRTSYEKIFLERQQDRKIFSNGHSILNLNIQKNSTEVSSANYQQISLFE